MPSALSVGVMVFVFFSLVIAFGVYLSTFPISEGYWVSRPDDDYANLFRIISSFEEEQSQEKVILIGSSALREAIVSPEHLRDNLRERRQNIQLQLCTAGDLSLVEMAQIVGALPADSQGVLILEISKRNFASSPTVTQSLVNNSRLPIAPLEYQKILLQQGLIPSVIPNYHTFFIARFRPFSETPVPRIIWNYHQIDAMPPPREDDWSRIQQKLEYWGEQSVIHHAWNRGFYENLIQSVPTGLRVVLLEVPRNPDLLKKANNNNLYQRSKVIYSENVRHLQDTFGIEYWNVHENIQGDKYIDYGHINKVSGRKMFTEELSKQIKNFWRKK